MASDEITLMAHLMRRAGFGASRDELEARAAKGYEATVEELLNPAAEAVDRYEFLRYHPGFWKPITSPGMGSAAWFHTMLNTQRPLEEKMVLFWHQVFATGQSKIDHWHELIAQVDMFREHAIGNYRELLVALAKDPAMIYWLDNCDNHAHAVNENWGRELLELFSMGVGNFAETDVREASRAFTGWTIGYTPPRGYYNRWDWQFEYLEEDHDEGEKTFLGQTGNFNGEDIIDIIVQQPACHRFIARHLYNFFVADEAQVPAWQTTPPRNPEAIDTVATAFRESQVRHALDPPGDVQLRLFQERPLYQDQEPSGGRHQSPKISWRIRVPRSQGLAIWPSSRRIWGRNCSIRRVSRAGTRGRSGSTVGP